MQISNAHDETIDHSFSEGETHEHKPDWLIILGHGVTGDKDRDLLVDTAESLNAIGFDTLRISFSGNGESGGQFTDSTISKEVEDLKAVLDAAEKDYKRLAYIGHSMGGAVGVLTAAQDPRIELLVSLAGMVDTQKFALEEFGHLEPGKDFMWDEKPCPLSAAFMNDLCKNVVNVTEQARQISIPWLLVHGTADDVVFPEDTDAIQALNLPNTTIRLIEKADHSFNEPAHRKAATEAVSAWLAQAVQST